MNGEQLLAALDALAPQMAKAAPGPWKMRHESEGKQILDRDGLDVALVLAEGDESATMVNAKAVLYAPSALDLLYRSLVDGKINPAARAGTLARWNDPRLHPTPWRVSRDPELLIEDANGVVVAFVDGMANANALAIASLYISRLIRFLGPPSP